jgi:hypothetical protein
MLTQTAITINWQCLISYVQIEYFMQSMNCLNRCRKFYSFALEMQILHSFVHRNEFSTQLFLRVCFLCLRKSSIHFMFTACSLTIILCMKLDFITFLFFIFISCFCHQKRFKFFFISVVKHERKLEIKRASFSPSIGNLQMKSIFICA